ncbi:MAG: entericidin A/B family lipoprotein [Legionellales bacterium]|nr:entericidin A/B family lipoprotein [Legionellales bacterium]
MMKKILIGAMACVICMSMSLLSGCNTVKGIGKDVSNGGKDLQRAAS